MKYVSIDIETTGLDESYCQILEIGAVIEDTCNLIEIDQLPKFHKIVYHDKIIGEPYALGCMNQWQLEAIAKRPTVFEYCSNDSLWSMLDQWLQMHFGSNKVSCAGKNFANFDKKFLAKLPRYNNTRFHHRTIDPGMLYWNPLTDTALPDMATCQKLAGINLEDYKIHSSALVDARLVVELIRKKGPV